MRAAQMERREREDMELDAAHAEGEVRRDAEHAEYRAARNTIMNAPIAEVVAMQEGDYFGEASLMGGDAPYDSPLHTMTVAAKGTLVCLTVERHAASTLLGSLQACACGPSLE